MIYVVSDLHGEYDKFIKMLDLIQFSNNDKMYILGDVIDRGKDSIKLLQFVINHQSNIEMLLGNHEEMMLETICNKYSSYISCWMNNGGESTYEQFKLLSMYDQHIIIDYLKQLPLYKIVDNYILVHSGIDTSYIPEKPISAKQYMDLQFKENLLWSREEFINYPAISNYKIIFGHTPTLYMYRWNNKNIHDITIWHDDKYNDKIGIDCGCCFKEGQLGCLRLDDMKEFYIK